MRTCLVLDAGIIMEWLVRRYEIDEGCTWPDQTFTIKILNIPAYLSAFEEVLSAHPQRLHMSAYAIAEVQKHERSAECALKDRHPGSADKPIMRFRSAFWARTSAAFGLRPIEEHHVKWLNLDDALLRDFGPADASLVAVAQRLNGDLIPQAITPDARLRARCHDIGVKALDPWELVGHLPNLVG